jgi:putative ABC transporter, permease protein
MREEFGRFHPVVNILFYAFILGITMFVNHPIMIFISFLFATVYFVIVYKNKQIKKLIGLLGLFIFAGLINPLFSHRGMTVLFFLPTGNAVTLESIIYGMFAAGILVTVMIWIFTFQKIVTEDKIMAVFGKIVPTLALIFSMVLKFVPAFVAHAKETSDVNRVMAIANESDINKMNFIRKVKMQVKNFSITATWALENSVDTADSMASRGYGVKRRTNFNNYKLTLRDIIALIWIIFLGGIVVLGCIFGCVKTHYYPMFYIEENKYATLVYITYSALCATPILINIMEEIRWLRLKSKI